MADRTDPRDWPIPRGPWPEVTGVEQIFDNGASWCINADGHPDYDYPDPELHVPAFECRTPALGVRAVPDLAGPDHTIALYVARSFRFGQSREPSPEDPPRLVVEITDDSGEHARFSIGLGDGLRLVRHVQRLIDLVDQPLEP